MARTRSGLWRLPLDQTLDVAVRETLVVYADGVQAAAATPAEFPVEYRKGVVQGLVVNEDGRVRLLPWQAADLVRIAESLGEGVDVTLDELTTAISGAVVSLATAPDAVVAFAQGLRAAATSEERSGSLHCLAASLEQVAAAQR